MSGEGRPAPAVRRFSGDVWGIAGLFLLAIAVRLFWGTRARVVWGDEPFYLWLGQSLLSGQGYEFFGISGIHFSPLFPILSQLPWRLGLTASPSAGSVALYVICGAALVLPIYGITARIAGRPAARIAGLATALYPALTAAIPLWGTMTEPLYLLLIATAWWALLVSIQEPAWWSYAVAGGALGLAYLTRTEAIVYVAAGLALALVLGWSTHAGRRGYVLRGILLAFAVFAVVISPYLVALHTETGRWQLAEEAGSTYVSAQGLALNNTASFDAATWGIDPSSGEVYLFSPSSEQQGLLAAILAEPRAFLHLLRVNVQDMLRTTFSGRLIAWPWVALTGLGLFGRAWDRKRTRAELLVAASWVGPLSFLPFFVQDRYMVGALVPALVWMGEGAIVLGDWLGETVAMIRKPADESTRHRSAHLWIAIAMAPVLLWQAPGLWNDLHDTHSFQPGHLAIAAEMRELALPSDAVVMARYPAIAFHAGMHWTPTPAASWPEILEYARRHDVRYLAIDEWETQLRPQIQSLLDPSTAPPELHLLAQLDSGSGPVVLYSIDYE